jgi:hypothetical protein
MRISLSMAWPVALVFAGCASSQGTRPHDMSTAQHEAAAEREHATAEQHEKLSQTDKTGAQRDAQAGRWMSVTNPTAQHKADAARHRELAMKHREGSQALRDAEASACVGIREGDRDTSPFYHREDITSVSQIDRAVQRGNVRAGQLAGGRAVFRAVPGLTAEWLQRVVNCHLARATATGNNMPEMPYCPLVLKDVKATVLSTGDGFAIDVTTADFADATEIWDRIHALAPEGTVAAVVMADIR